jgi:hypothetical protein
LRPLVLRAEIFHQICRYTEAGQVAMAQRLATGTGSAL